MNKTSLLLFSLILLSLIELNAQNNNTISIIPAWSKDAVWYQIFPERFSNGDKSNDPAPTDMKGAWPYEIPPGWKISPWESDWYKLQSWEKADGHDFYWNAGIRRYGGDLQGIINHLDYLRDLGITAIYLTPIFESPSLHKYDTRMYHHIDNNFGPDPKDDEKIWESENPADPKTWKWTSADKLFLKLISEVHSRGMKIIIDGVFNHVDTTFWAFQDVIKNQQKSLYKDWFTIKSWDDPNTPENEFDYVGWAGVKDLLEIKKDDKNGLIKGFGDHLHFIIKRWMDPDGEGYITKGIDGWRLDVAEMINLNFWRQFRIWVKEINPEAYIAGEILWENWWYKKLISIRKEYKVLSEGRLDFFYLNDSDKVIGYKRTLEKESIFMIINSNSNSKSVLIESKLFNPGNAKLSALLNTKNIKVENNNYKIDLKPYQLMILING